MTIETVTEQTDEPGTDPYGHYGTETIPAAQLRLGDVIDYPHGPAAIVGLASPDYLTYALGPGSVAIRHASRAPARSPVTSWCGCCCRAPARWPDHVAVPHQAEAW